MKFVTYEEIDAALAAEKEERMAAPIAKSIRAATEDALNRIRDNEAMESLKRAIIMGHADGELWINGVKIEETELKRLRAELAESSRVPPA